ncbi:MAG TPA: hypothetical protein VJS69_00070 [Candidatus Krumholzibacteria bacterium]|nr:hypothetical protein [Candidatus Krumholzibacteria bacterium]
MKYLLSILLLVVALFPCAVAADPIKPVIGVYTLSYLGDPPQCLMEHRAGLVTLWVVQDLSLETKAVRFKVETSPGFTGFLVSWSAPNGTTVGNPYTGITVTYNQCIPGSVVTVLEMTWMMSGIEADCSYIRTAADPSSVDGFLDLYDCAGNRKAAEWAGTHIQTLGYPNGFPFVLCSDLAGVGHTGYGCRPVEQPVPVDESTWGAVKALYR